MAKKAKISSLSNCKPLKLQPHYYLNGYARDRVRAEDGIITMRQGANMATFIEQFLEAMRAHRHWNRVVKEQVTAS